jgi:DNA repair protein RadC
VSTTSRLIDAGKILEIQVMDYLIIGRGSFVSLRERFTKLEWQ